MIDVGANLAHDSFDADRGAVLERAAAAGVEAIIITGSSAESSRRALDLTRGHTPLPLYSTAGLHPHHAADWDAVHAELLRELAREPQVVALGECGLDYFRDYSPRADQRRAFAAQLALAAELGKPVFLHQREAHADFLAMLREYRPRLADAVVHCFTDGAAEADDYLALDCHIGVTGWVCDERRNVPLLQAVPRIPPDRLLLETDAPYLLPRNVRPRPDSRRNEPAFLPRVAEAVARARSEPLARVLQCSMENARRFFRLRSSPAAAQPAVQLG